MDSSDIKVDASPTGSGQFSFQRTNSASSLPNAGCTSSASSAHNTDEEDGDSDTPIKTQTYRDRRREAHTVAEQKRRDAIKSVGHNDPQNYGSSEYTGSDSSSKKMKKSVEKKKKKSEDQIRLDHCKTERKRRQNIQRGYDELMSIVPSCNQPDSVASQKMSKATVLQKSIDYMQYLANQKKRQDEDLENLRKEVMALKIMKLNYEHIVQTHQNSPQHGQNQVTDEMKFHVFKQIMESLFQTFNQSISVANFAELSACVFSWLEEYCKPQSLRESVMEILKTMPSTQQPPQS